MLPRSWWFGLGAWALSVACSGNAVTPSTPPQDARADAPMDATSEVPAPMDVPPVDVPPDRPLADSGCPPPGVVTPTMAPAIYLPPVAGQLVRPVDGDTAHIFLMGSGEQILRFLYVNTEESHGAETTAFGIATADLVAAWLRSARRIDVTVRRDRAGATQPDLDPYDRWLSLIYVDGELFQTRLVREGLSAYYTQFGCAPEPIHSALLWAEAEARANQRGIWRPGHPTDYRVVFQTWIGSDRCRPNPYLRTYCN